MKTGGLTALISSCSNLENDNVTKLLIKAGADLNLVTDAGSSALVEAVKTSNYDLVHMLLNRGAFIYHKDPNLIMDSPFHVAVRD